MRVGGTENRATSKEWLIFETKITNNECGIIWLFEGNPDDVADYKLCRREMDERDWLCFIADQFVGKLLGEESLVRHGVIFLSLRQIMEGISRLY